MKQLANKPETKQKVKCIVYMVCVICIAIVVEMVILDSLSQKNADKTMRVMLDQVSSILESNQEEEAAMNAALKEEYIVRAQSVAYMLDANPDAVNDAAELKKIAGLMKIDEIHLFNAKGVIYSGTVPDYYGYGLDSGEQIAYFKPMQQDKTLSMCQDVTPNTAEGKSMMYAATWNEAGTVMVQVGIEPVRYLEELRKNEISEVIDRIPVHDDLMIHVADVESGVICGSTDASAEGMTLDELGLPKKNIDLTKTISVQMKKDGFRYFCRLRQCGNYVIAVIYSTENYIESFTPALLIELLYLLVAGCAILYMFNRVLAVNKRNSEQLSVLTSMAEIYYSMHLIDLKNDFVQVYNASGTVKEIVKHEYGVAALMRQVINATSKESCVEQVLTFTDLDTLPERMRDTKIITMEFDGKDIGWTEASFITIEADEEGKPTKVIFVTRDIDQEKKKEEKLIEESTTDELTGFFNRHAYESDVNLYKDTITEDNFVYISMDVNGLKIVNDSLGHAAGDELIKGAAFCMKRCMGAYGRIYRTGGDEFSAIIFATEDELEAIKKDFEDVTRSWSGELVDSLAVSCGYVAKREVETTSVHEISLLADARMYEAKEAFYRKKGVDRRGQKEAHAALCKLYTKILKINLTEDSFQIVDMDINEQAESKGYADTISAWLRGFGTAGQVHEEDLEGYLAETNIEYLRKYFLQEKTSLSIFYRRKFGEDYKKVMMELIPASDYTEENQTLFLYVKNIDK